MPGERQDEKYATKVSLTGTVGELRRSTESVNQRQTYRAVSVAVLYTAPVPAAVLGEQGSAYLQYYIVIRA